MRGFERRLGKRTSLWSIDQFEVRLLLGSGIGSVLRPVGIENREGFWSWSELSLCRTELLRIS